MSSSSIATFRKEVLSYYKRDGRNDLPWRKTTDPYKILVSEVMLQQTQVARVIEKYKSFLKKFPTVRALAKAPLSEVLKEWSGLGYNRRGKYLHDAAKDIVEKYGGDFGKAFDNKLSGVGPYTKSAVKVFAFNELEVLLETNVRTAIIHHFFPNKGKVADVEIEKIATTLARGQDPRTWQSALFDYGSYLKRSSIRNNNRSKHYTKQSKFEGSLRQIRGAILRTLGSKPARLNVACDERFPMALMSLARDGLIVKEKGKWRIA